MKKLILIAILLTATTSGALFAQDEAEQYSTYFNEGVKKSGEQNFKDAIELFNKALEIKADYKEALFARGQCYLLTDERNKACDDFEKCTQLGLNQANEYIEKYCGKNAPGRTQKPSVTISPK